MPYKESNYFHKFNVSSTQFAIVASWNFISVGIALMVESNDPNDVIEYSFDGSTVHGDLTPGMPSQGIVFDNRFESKVWLRRAWGGPSVLVRVESWRHGA